MRCLFLGLLIFSGVSFACQFDSECDVGFRCMDVTGDTYGMCVPAANPYNNDLPLLQETDPMPVPKQDVTGNPCQFDADCGYGGACIKPSGSIYGDCK